MLQARVFDYISTIETADAGQVRASFAQTILGAGYTAYGCTEMPGPSRPLADCVLLNGWPPEWAARYFARDYVRSDPVVHFMRCRTEPYTWAQVLARLPAKSDAKIVHEAGAFAMRSGLIVPLYGLSAYTAMVTMSGPAADDDPKVKAALHLIAIYTHQRLRELRGWMVPRPPDLTPREAECLLWAGRGKSDWEIGEILNVSERTAHWHIENAKRKLGVTTRVQAVVSAFYRNQIAP